MIYKKTGNLRAVQLLLGHTKIESTVRYLGIEVDDALTVAEQIDVSSLNSKIAKMGGLAEQVVGQSLAALEKRDRTLAKRTELRTKNHDVEPTGMRP